MADQLQIITTGDGSHSLLNSALNETYHSVHGAKRESIHVFINQGLEYLLKKHSAPIVNIFEVGFGTGLNALLTAMFATKNLKQIKYTSIESFPLSEEIWQALNYCDNEEEQTIFSKLHSTIWESELPISEFFSLVKKKTTLQDLEIPVYTYDLIYFDAFAPSKQPELWEIAILQKVARALKSGGIFVTYCAKGQFKRDLKSLGFEVQTLPGPPGKKEMVRGLKIS